MDGVSAHLRRALDAECATGVDEVVDARRPGDLEALRALLRDDADVSPSYRHSAIHILGRWGDGPSAPAIRRLLPSLDERGRINAIVALGHIGGAEAEAAALASATDASPDVRRFAAYALADLGTPAALRRLREVQRDDPADFVRTAAARGLRQR